MLVVWIVAMLAIGLLLASGAMIATDKRKRPTDVAPRLFQYVDPDDPRIVAIADFQRRQFENIEDQKTP